jgi:hypothetical protein
MGTMDLAACTDTPTRAPQRCEERGQRLLQVKFVALELEPEHEPAPETETLSHSPARLYRDVRVYLIRAIERLVAARP